MIVFCHLLNDASGSPRVLASTIEALDCAQANNLLYVGHQGRGLLEASGIEIRRYCYRRSATRLVTFVSYFLSQIHLYIRLARDPDILPEAVIYVNTLLPFGAALWGRRTGRPVIIHLHEVTISPPPLRWLLKKCATKCASQLIYVSEDQLQRIPIFGPAVDVISNPVSSKLANRATNYKPRRSGGFNVLMLTSIRHYKGIAEFFRLAKDLVDRKDITFSLVLNADAAEVCAVSRMHAKAENVTIHSKTDEPELFYRLADLVLNLSRVDQIIETFGLTLVEAMTFGIPVIAPPVGGPAQIVTNGREGYCIDSRDGDELCKKVLGLADNPETALQMSQAARKRAESFVFSEYSENVNRVLARFYP